MKKLLIFAKTIDGGTGTYLTNLLKIKNVFAKELLITVAVLEKPIYMQRNEDNIFYMKKRDYSLKRYSLSYKNIKNFVQEMFWFSKIILSEKPDIILAVDVNCNILTGTTQFLFRNNFKSIFTTHSDLSGNLEQRSTNFLTKFLNGIIRFIYNRSDILISVSDELASSLHLDFGIKREVSTIFNGLDINEIYKKNSVNDTPIILTVARLDKQKDHLTLLRAFDLVVKEIKNVELWIVGDGPLKDELNLFVRKINLNDNVKFFGWHQNIKEFFINSDIFVLSSNREGFPYSLIEAMSHGLPVVCTNTPFGPKEILNNSKYGFLVPMKSYNEMKNAILELLSNKNTYQKYSHLAYERSRFFSTDKMINSYANEIRRLL